MADIPPRHPSPDPVIADPPLSPIVADAKRLKGLLGVGLRTVRTWDAGGKLPKSLKIGGKTVWLVSEIRDWLAAGAPDRETWQAIKAAKK